MREKDIELKKILNSIPYEITVKDLDYNYIYANEKFCRNFNCNFNEIYKKNMSELWNEEDCKKISEIDKEVIEKNKGIFCLGFGKTLGVSPFSRKVGWGGRYV